MDYYGWRPYVPVAQRRANAMRAMEKLRKKGHDIQPVRIDGRQIARTFWGKAWCEHLEKFSDFENRLPRGRTYVRNGSVCHLSMAKGRIVAKVCGSELYDIEIAIKPLSKDKWRHVKESCAGQVGSLLELLQGRLSDHVMQIVTDRDRGLFPLPGEIDLDCSCPDWADMCKHVAAVMYGIGARLDEMPELLFVLRGVDHTELVGQDAAKAVVTKAKKTGRRTLAESELSEVFGIDVETTHTARDVPSAVDSAVPADDLPPPKAATRRPTRSRQAKKSSAKSAGAKRSSTQASRKKAAGHGKKP
jgi:uncharacterized Zn finger protein